MNTKTSSIVLAAMTAASTSALTIVDTSDSFRNRWTDQTVSLGPDSFTFAQTFTVPGGEAWLDHFTIWAILPQTDTRFTWSLSEALPNGQPGGAVISTGTLAANLPFDEPPSPDFLTGYTSVEVFAHLQVAAGQRYVSTWTATDPNFILAMASMQGDSAYEDGTAFQWEREELLPVERDLAFVVTFGLPPAPVPSPGTVGVPEEANTIALLAIALPFALAAARRKRFP